MAKTLELSEFISNQDLNLHYKDTNDGLVSCGNEDKAAINIKLAKGDKIPIVFIPKFLEHNRQFLANLEYKEGKPFLTTEQEEKYNVKFGETPTTPPKKYAIYTMEKLMNRWKKMGEDKFKDWAEKTFGEENIDKRKTPRNIIVEIRRLVG